MRERPKGPPVPGERHETIRQEIMACLKGQTRSARDISAEVRLPEKEVYDHLDHIQRTLGKGAHHLTITPAQCKKCGFTFRKRERLRKPGRCPVCRSESIEEPLF